LGPPSGFPFSEGRAKANRCPAAKEFLVFPTLRDLFRRPHLRRDWQKELSKKFRPRLEALEDRMLLSATLNITSTGQATYTGSTLAGDSVTLSEQPYNSSFVQRIFTDPVDTINVTQGNVTGSGTHTVTWYYAPGTGTIRVNMEASGDVVNVQSSDIPITVDPFILGGTVNVELQTTNNGTVESIRKPVTVAPPLNGGITTNVNVDDSADAYSHHWTISDTAIGNEFGTLVRYQQASEGALDITLTSNNPTTVSANLFTVTNTVTASGFAYGSSTTINTGSGNEGVSVQGTTGPLTIQGHGGNDGVSIGSGGSTSTLANILGSVTVRDTAPTMNLGVADSGDTTSHANVTLSDSALIGLGPANIYYQASGLQNNSTIGNPGLNVATGEAPDTVTVTNTPPTALLAWGNTSGTEQLNVQGITGTLIVQQAGGATGALKVVVGSKAPGTGGTLAEINGLVDLLDYSNTNLIVDDSGDTKARTVTMTDLGIGPSTDNGEITGLATNATIAYSPSDLNVNSTVTLNGGSGGDTFNIVNTTLYLTGTTINGKGGDTFNVTTTQSPLTLNTGSGSNHVNILGSSIDYVLTLGPAPVSVVGHGGNDTVTVGSLAPALGGTLANVLGAVYVSNTTNSTALVVDDSGDTTARLVSIGSGSVRFAGIGQQVVFGAGVKSVDVYGGTGDMFQLGYAAPTTKVTLHGGPGVNYLVSGSYQNTWILTGTNAGTLQGVAFQNIQNLQGSVYPYALDTFIFAPGGGVNGSIRRGGNPTTVATLDYSHLGTQVTVDLKTHFATGVLGGVFGVQNVTGGQGNNILVGDGNNNTLKGGNGRDILISGGGTSTLQAGNGEAILIGAHYVNDTSLTALDALLAEWSHTYDSTNPLHDYQIRVSHLLYLLNSSTVVPQPGTTTLITGGQLDFLFYDLGDILGKALRPGEVAVYV
jgi:hypothetical protein